MRLQERRGRVGSPICGPRGSWSARHRGERRLHLCSPWLTGLDFPALSRLLSLRLLRSVPKEKGRLTANTWTRQLHWQPSPTIQNEGPSLCIRPGAQRLLTHASQALAGRFSRAGRAGVTSSPDSDSAGNRGWEGGEDGRALADTNQRRTCECFSGTPRPPPYHIIHKGELGPRTHEGHATWHGA